MPQFIDWDTRFPLAEPLHSTHGAEPFLRSCQLCSHSRTFQHFMDPEGSLPSSQEPSTGPYPEPDRSSPQHPILSLLRSISILSTHLCLGLPSGLFPSELPTNILHAFLFSPIRATCPAPGPRLCECFRNKLIFYGEEFLAPRPTPKLEDHSLSVVRDCFFSPRLTESGADAAELLEHLCWHSLTCSEFWQINHRWTIFSSCLINHKWVDNVMK
jgi:hypothetical protein